jgi:hypothetical protein
MATFVVRELEGDVLLSLSSLRGRLPLPRELDWVFHNVQLNPVGSRIQPFGLNIPEFERLTHAPEGYRATQWEFDEFLGLDIQFIDGRIACYSSEEPHRPLLTLECVDSSQWEISTQSREMSRKLVEVGFRENPASER